MEYGVMFDKIRKMIEEDPDNITILEEVIDVDLQMKYFKVSLDVKKSLNIEQISSRKEDLFSAEMAIETKKTLLNELASLNNVEALRAIEKYMQTPDDELREWSILAFQESKMLIQSSLLNKSPVFISTGLGGKKGKLRYCLVIFSTSKLPFTQLQQNVIVGELDYMAKKNNVDIEEVSFSNHYCIAIMLIPLVVSVKDSLFMMVENCNELGDFVDPAFLVTNVKRLRDKDIQEAMNKKNDDHSNIKNM
jgi:hypothetical protein